MDHCRYGIGSVYDTAWPCAFLRWSSARTKRAKCLYAGLRHRLFNECTLAGGGLHDSVWIRHIWLLGWIGQNVPLGHDRWSLKRHDTRCALYGLPNDFRNYHSSVDCRGICRPNEI